MTGCQCQAFLSLKQRQWLPNVIFQHLPNQTVEIWLKGGLHSAALTYFSKNTFLTSFFYNIGFWRVKQFSALRAHMRIMFNFHHWSRKSCEAKAQQRQIMWGLLSLHKYNGNEMILQLKGNFHGFLKKKYKAQTCL